MEHTTKEARDMRSALTCFDIEIDAPDGAAALALEQRMAHLAPTMFAHGNHWTVEVPAAESAEELEAAVRGWLAQIGQAETTMRIAGREVRVAGHPRPRRPRHHPTHERFIG
jgi:hypothetical protein